MNNNLLQKILIVQRSEMTEHVFYKKVAAKQKKQANKNLLNHIAEVELNHYNFWKKFSNQDTKPNIFKIYFYYFIVFLFGITFGVRLMEKKHKKIKLLYLELSQEIEGIDYIIDDENNHEKMHIDEIDEERLKYISSIVLGLNDALVEFTGAIAGLTFALSNTKLVALSGMIAGISASLSMASSEYLSTKQNANHRYALVSATYTGVTYLLAVLLMILPYLVFSNILYSLFTMLIIVVVIIFMFNYYIAIAKELSFKKRFSEMIVISLGVATLSFLMGLVVRSLL